MYCLSFYCYTDISYCPPAERAGRCIGVCWISLWFFSKQSSFPSVHQRCNPHVEALVVKLVPARVYGGQTFAFIHGVQTDGACFLSVINWRDCWHLRALSHQVF